MKGTVSRDSLSQAKVIKIVPRSKSLHFTIQSQIEETQMSAIPSEGSLLSKDFKEMIDTGRKVNLKQLTKELHKESKKRSLTYRESRALKKKD